MGNNLGAFSLFKSSTLRVLFEMHVTDFDEAVSIASPLIADTVQEEGNREFSLFRPTDDTSRTR